ncbi:MAG: M48 family metallopeptidase [Nitrospirae bacterium]|nr:M48 family metallopeptidase [Nitrospirota bacterium]
MNKLLYLILTLYVMIQIFSYWLTYLNIRHLKIHGAVIPPDFEGYIDQNLLLTSKNYIIDKTKLDVISSIFNHIITIIFIFCGILNFYNSWVTSLNLGFISAGILFFIIISLVSTILSIPFDLYHIFKIEARYGFNTMTIGLWIKDFLKSSVISVIIYCIITSFALYIVLRFPNSWWVLVWGTFLFFSLMLMYIAPYVIEPLFNKFTPLSEELGLKEEIENLLAKTGLKVSKILKIDASKRSRHSNAYFTGIGKVKRIVLYDTLLDTMTTGEILSILAHELGHWKKKHLLKYLIVFESFGFVFFYAAKRVMEMQGLEEIFSIAEPSFYVKVILIGFISGIVFFPLTPLVNFLQRRNERQADIISLQLTGNKKDMISALVKLSKDNLSNLHPHPLYAMFHYSHPPVLERITEINEIKINHVDN